MRSASVEVSNASVALCLRRLKLGRELPIISSVWKELPIFEGCSQRKGDLTAVIEMPEFSDRLGLVFFM